MNEQKTLTIKEMKAVARGKLIGKYPAAIFAVLIVSIASYLAMLVEINVISDTTGGYLMGLVIEFIVDLLLGILIYARSAFFLKLIREKETPAPKEFFASLKGRTDKAILIQAVFTLFSFIGIIPEVLLHFNLILVPEEYSDLCSYGIIGLQALITFIADLYFGMSFYVMADHEEMSATEILKESLSIMRNKKGRLFLTYLSSLPLLLLGICACGVGTLWFEAFFEALLVVFYLNAIGEDPSPKPETPDPTQRPWAG